jgi:ATP-dependent Lon protease
MTEPKELNLIPNTILDKDKERKRVSSDIIGLIAKKMVFFQDIIQKTILHVQKNKLLEIIGVSEVSTCISTLFALGKKIKDISDVPITVCNTDSIINILQTINNDLSSLFKIFGTDSFEDLLWICFGNNSVKTYAISDMEMNKFELLKRYFHPTSYKLLPSKSDISKSDISKSDILKKDLKDEFVFTEKSKNLDIIELSIKVKSFHLRVYGFQIIVHNPQHKKSLIISGTVDDVLIGLIDNKFVTTKSRVIKDNLPLSKEFKETTFNRYIASLSLKDYLMYETHEIYAKYAGYLSHLSSLRQKPVSQVIKEFIASELYVKRLTLIQLLIQLDKNDNQYLAYLLYDLMSNDANGTIDTLEQTILFDSFPWSIKQFFKDAMTQTIKYTSELTNFDSQKIPLEQQICLLKANDTVKEKAMQKLKEVKSKSDDSGSKARQYLDGLLKIPFNIYKREPILNLMNEIKTDYLNYIQLNDEPKDNNKSSYTSLEILAALKNETIKTFKNEPIKTFKNEPQVKNEPIMDLDAVYDHVSKANKNELGTYIKSINALIKEHKLSYAKLKISNMVKSDIVIQINDFIKNYKDNESILLTFLSSINFSKSNNVSNLKEGTEKSDLTGPLLEIESKFKQISEYMDNVKSILDDSVYGHEKAKKQVERIIGQWVSGNDNTGYVLGFEGAPGIGKTTLAKGLSNCLKDAEGISRPFSLIAIGGDANSSSLVGHSYTYVGSTWGQIVQILMDKKCMNPIILIDEVDKISKTEHGKEIIGILTHLLDTSQNDGFQDKYFSGIELDLSKVLFILSYNDVEAIDRILLDRVHRIKFDSLSIEDKIVICNKHLLPEMYKKIGLENMVEFKEETLKYIIEEYTLEPGVRKIKEKLFEIIGELNLDILKRFTKSSETLLPIQITIDDIKNKYFKDKREMRVQKIHDSSQIGVVNCLYATSSGTSGILSASAKLFPADKFLELRLTGLLDQMMQESFQISLTLAFNLLSDARKEELNVLYNGDKKYGIHLHMGDGSISKSGTSAGIAITLLMYSLLNNTKIKNTFAVTGEASDLNGSVGEIGALQYKFQGGIKAGVKSFIFPKDNSKDYDDFMKKYGTTKLVEGISFHQISHISEAIELIMDF